MSIALDGFGESERELVSHRREIRIHREGAPEHRRRVAWLAEGQMAQTLSREGAEVIRLAGDGLLAIGDGAFVVAREVAHGGALVPAFGEVGRARGEPGEARFGLDEILALHRLDALEEKRVDLGNA